MDRVDLLRRGETEFVRIFRIENLHLNGRLAVLGGNKDFLGGNHIIHILYGCEISGISVNVDNDLDWIHCSLTGGCKRDIDVFATEAGFHLRACEADSRISSRGLHLVAGGCKAKH